jgi:phosphoribosylaminoimidazole-succinocarboxamide synthase
LAKTPGTVAETAVYETELAGLTRLHRGKVRDLYALDADRMLIVATDRLSAFDVVLPDPIPGKGRVLNEISLFWFARTAHIVPNHLTGLPLSAAVSDPVQRELLDGRAVIVRRLAALPIEAVVRGYLIGSGWKDYRASGAICGIPARACSRRSSCRRRSSPRRPRRPRGEHDENISFAVTAQLIGAPLAAAVRECALALYASRPRTRARAASSSPTPSSNSASTRRAADADRRGADARLLALLAGRHLARGHEPAVLRQAVRARLPGNPRLEQARSGAAPAAGDHRAHQRQVSRSAAPAHQSHAGMSTTPAQRPTDDSRHPASESIWIRLQRLPDRLMFGPQAELPGAGHGCAAWRATRMRCCAILPAASSTCTPLAWCMPACWRSSRCSRSASASSPASMPRALSSRWCAISSRPMGSAADELSGRVMEFANTVRGGLVGSVGLALLIWTLLSTMKKVEDGFNFVWHVDQPRNSGAPPGRVRRAADHRAGAAGRGGGTVAAGGRQRTAAHLERAAAGGAGGGDDAGLAPYLIASGLLTLIYMVVPNTRVRLLPALAGGVSAGILWAAVGRFFTLFVLYSARLTIVYAGFAIVIATLVWTYFNWIILLIGAQVSFYAQNPSYLRVGLREPRLSCADVERLALGIMYLVAARHRARRRARHDRAAQRPARLSRHRGRAHVCHAGSRGFPRRRGRRRAAARARQRSDPRGRHHHGGARPQQRPDPRASTTPAVVLEFCSELERAWQQRCGQLTLSQLLDRAAAATNSGDAAPAALPPQS